ncbi:MAG: hypothetical protein JW862_18555 [Anaerolineales bacterium]|nr:hypothetical protein [Anaerolineales bacterium]
MSEVSVLSRMQTQIEHWELAHDPRLIFLQCYQLMTANMLTAIQQAKFEDGPWVDRLLHRFADYYFVALDTYEQQPSTAPPVWTLTHERTLQARILPVQMLLLGVNAHINYDLVLTLVELLQPEWETLPAHQRQGRYRDHCLVNIIIANSIDAVQDQVLEPAMPGLDLLDRWLGGIDERLISGLIRRWRESVWQNAQAMLESNHPGSQEQLRKRVEADALRLAEWLS